MSKQEDEILKNNWEFRLKFVYLHPQNCNIRAI